MREVLNENDFRSYVINGFVNKNGNTIKYYDSDLEILISGGVVTQGDLQFCLSDMGYCKIYDIIKGI